MDINRKRLEEIEADEFYSLPEMRLVELITNVDSGTYSSDSDISKKGRHDDVEKVLIIDELLSTSQKDEDRAQFVNWIKENYGI